MWDVDSQFVMPSNAVINHAQPVALPCRKSESVEVYPDETADFEQMHASGEKSDLPADAILSKTVESRRIVLIDNTSLEYLEVMLPCGVRVMCSPEVLSTCPMILRSLQTDCRQLFRILPRSVHDLLRRTKIWVNASYAYGSRDDPRVLRHSTAHHSEGWLVHCAKDIPDKAKGIEVYNCHDFERMRLHWNGCGLILHEFCHLIHQFCLGLDNISVKRLYERARDSGLYEQTLRRDWAGLDQDFDMAYAMIDQKEFFAEMSVTFLSNSYHALSRADKTIMECCCPPLLQPAVSDRVLRRHGIKDPLERHEESVCSFLYYRRHPTPILKHVNPIFQESAISTNCRGVAHCNKFYPFTRGQLRYHDPDLFCAMQGLWREIARWKDPEAEAKSRCSLPLLPVLFC
eukprot:scaffold2597_cov116-Cylindrotheca_fusiformis.AAC.9